MTDNDIKTISEKIDSLHKKILKSKFAEKVTESEMVSLILAVQFLNRQKTEIEELRKGFKADMDYFESEYDSKIKSEAVKEFAERLKKQLTLKGGSLLRGSFEWGRVKDYEIDDLVKEMTEQTTFEKVEHNSLCETETYKKGEL